MATISSYEVTIRKKKKKQVISVIPLECDLVEESLGLYKKDSA